MTARTIHLVFKTHLDIGFTDHAEKVRRQYHDRFIPQAIDTGEHFFREDARHPAFIWTTGAWLIWDHLNSQPRAKVKRLEQAIERGLIRWHALPFTTHSELMSPALFRAGLSYAAELDRRFGVTTIAAKMTDVPGHTRGIVPILAEAGVKFLHLGVNAASPVPEVPEIFRWQAEGAEVLVMYQNSYGATHFPEGFDDGLSFAHTNDNMGPQSVPQTAEAYRTLRHAHPGAAIKAATLDDYAALLWARRADFPVVDLEIGDSWIHGAASDPQKLQRFLALQRLYDGFARENLTPQRLAFGRRLALVAEHTWGVDVKSYLRDESAWDRRNFEAARHGDHRFAYVEASWAEQRTYLDAAVKELDAGDKALARGALLPMKIPPAARTRAAAPAETRFTLRGWSVEIDPETGDIGALEAPDGTPIAGRAGTLFGYRHESYDAGDVERFRDSYITNRFEWALLDFGKPGLADARTARSRRWQPKLLGTTPAPDRLTIALELPPQARSELGAPHRVELVLYPFDATQIQLSVILREKPANRMPEAGFLLLTPDKAADWEFGKMGLRQAGNRIVRRGGGNLQAVDAVRTGVRGTPLQVIPLDTPLVAPATGDFMRFETAPPDLSAGVRFNLYNSKWGTNFAMWWSGDLLARFVLKVGA